MSEMTQYHTGGGCMALRITDQAYPELFVYVTDNSYAAIPENPEDEQLVIGVYPENDAFGEHLKIIEVGGRIGMMELLEEAGAEAPAPNADINDVIRAAAKAMMQQTTVELAEKPSRSIRPR